MLPLACLLGEREREKEKVVATGQDELQYLLVGSVSHCLV